MANELTIASPAAAISVFSNEAAFDVALRLIKPLVASNLVPVAYRGPENSGNALIALDMANRMGISPIVVMQNLHVIEGRPSWSSTFIIGALGSCGLFSPIRWKIRDLGEVEAEKVEWSGPKGDRQKRVIKQKINDKEFIAYAVEKQTGEILEGPPVTFSMAIAEGWYGRPGSKWLTMPDLMGRYRAAAFFGRLYAPHITNGMPMEDEVVDVTDYRVIEPEAVTSAEAKPAGRPSGLHAAMQSGKEEPEAAKPKPAARTAKPKPAAEAKPAPAPEPEDAEVYEDSETASVSHTDDVDNSSSQGGNDDVFGSPEEDFDDYDPA